MIGEDEKGPHEVPPEPFEPQVAASDPDASAFVTANAGAGKTWTLVARVARLLLRGVSYNVTNKYNNIKKEIIMYICNAPFLHESKKL